MARGRPPKSDIIKLHAGSDAPNRPLPGIPDPPPHLNSGAKKIWKWLAKQVEAMGNVTQADQGIMALYCMAYDMMVQAEKAIHETMKESDGKNPYVGYVIGGKHGFGQNPYVGIRNSSMAQVAKYGSMLGLDPMSRSKVGGVGLDKKQRVPSRDRSKGPPPPKGATA